MTMQMHIAAKIHPEEIGPHNPVPRIEDRRPLPQKSKLATELYSGGEQIKARKQLEINLHDMLFSNDDQEISN